MAGKCRVARKLTARGTAPKWKKRGKWLSEGFRGDAVRVRSEREGYFGEDDKIPALLGADETSFWFPEITVAFIV